MMTIEQFGRRLRTREMTAVRATEQGAFDYLPKPFDIDALTRAVEGPSVIDALQAIAVDKTQRELDAAMRAAPCNQVHLARFAAIQGQILAENAQRLDMARGKIG